MFSQEYCEYFLFCMNFRLFFCAKYDIISLFYNVIVRLEEDEVFYAAPLTITGAAS